MITLSNTQFTELQDHLNAMQSILSSIISSDDEVQVPQPVKCHMPKKSVAAIERLIDLLDPAVTTAADWEQLCRRLGASFGG